MPIAGLAVLQAQLTTEYMPRRRRQGHVKRQEESLEMTERPAIKLKTQNTRTCHKGLHNADGPDLLLSNTLLWQSSLVGTWTPSARL